MGRPISGFLAAAFAGAVGCATTADVVRERAAASWSCAPASVQVRQNAPDEYEATGCAMRAVYECTKKRHHRAQGARYEVCRRVSQHPVAEPLGEPR